MSILVFIEQRDGKIRSVAHEALGAATRVAAALGGPVVGVCAAAADPGLAVLGAAGASEVLLATHEAFGVYDPAGYVAAVLAAAEQVKPSVIVFPASSIGRDLAPRVAARLGAGFASEVTELGVEGGKVVATRPVYAGKAQLKVKLTGSPAVISLRPNVFTPAQNPKAGTAQTAVVAGDAGRVVVKEIKAAPAGSLDVAEATIVVSGGRGLKEPANFALIEKLVAAFGGRAALGASRAVVDAGWRPHGDQVGQTGKTVSPSLYIAVGISGAIQHLAGMRTAKCIVAINKDKDAPIFKVADYGIVGDLFEIVPRLTEEIGKLHQ